MGAYAAGWIDMVGGIRGKCGVVLRVVDVWLQTNLDVPVHY